MVRKKLSQFRFENTKILLKLQFFLTKTSGLFAYSIVLSPLLIIYNKQLSLRGVSSKCQGFKEINLI